MSIQYPCVHWNEGKCKKFSDDKVTSWCVKSPCEDQMPSNADCIRAMSDEELAKNLVYEMCNYCYEPRTEKCYRKCADNMLKWLKQPAE